MLLLAFFLSRDWPRGTMCLFWLIWPVGFFSSKRAALAFLVIGLLFLSFWDRASLCRPCLLHRPGWLQTCSVSTVPSIMECAVQPSTISALLVWIRIPRDSWDFLSPNKQSECCTSRGSFGITGCSLDFKSKAWSAVLGVRASGVPVLARFKHALISKLLLLQCPCWV